MLMMFEELLLFIEVLGCPLYTTDDSRAKSYFYRILVPSCKTRERVVPGCR